jgi:acyl-coenzyme A synthetase/AMP-(fatty) acid ligase
MVELQDVLTAPRPDAVAALSPGGPRSWQELEGLAAAAARRAAGGGRWLLACEDAFLFAAGFLGLARAGCTPVLPPNFLPDTLAGLSVDGVLDAAALAVPAEPAYGPLPDVPVEFWTSGSTGDPKRVARTFDQMAREVRILEELFGKGLAGTPVAGTVPHQHIYGFLFRILWPLASGRPFLTAPCGTPEELRRAAEGHPVLVASPAHLARLPRLMALEGLAFPAIFSSGGPLQAEDAQAWRCATPVGVVEIFGSTETGGVAWRIPGSGPAPDRWTPFPDTTLHTAPDGALLIRSSRLAPPGIRMEDAVDLAPDGTFTLRGRLDRVVKVEEKRVSLPQVETLLMEHPAVRDAAVVLLGGPRAQLGAVVSPAGKVPEDAAERRDLIQTLRAHLSTRLEGPALPRKWRFLVEIPRDGRGKRSVAAVAALFDAPPELPHHD